MKKAPKEKLPEPVMNGEPVIDPNVFLDKPQMARLLQVSIGTVNNRVADGTLAHLKLGRRIYFTEKPASPNFCERKEEVSREQFPPDVRAVASRAAFHRRTRACVGCHARESFNPLKPPL